MYICIYKKICISYSEEFDWHMIHDINILAYSINASPVFSNAIIFENPVP